jgi:hypothetical protein
VLGEIRRQRIDKVHQLREQGIDPYPPDAVDRVSIARAREIADGEPATIAGRIMLLRPMGNLTFGQLHDETGEMQFMISRRDLPEGHVPGYKALTKLLDIGEFVAVEGYRLQPNGSRFPDQRAAGGLTAGQGQAGPAGHRGAVPRHHGRERAGQRVQRAERPAGAGPAVRGAAADA